MLKVTSQPSMSVIPYNNGNKDVLYHNPNDGVLVVHDRQENTISLVSTMTLIHGLRIITDQEHHHNHLQVTNSLIHQVLPSVQIVGSPGTNILIPLPEEGVAIKWKFVQYIIT